jgi:hypothetical protein
VGCVRWGGAGASESCGGFQLYDQTEPVLSSITLLSRRTCERQLARGSLTTPPARVDAANGLPAAQNVVGIVVALSGACAYTITKLQEQRALDTTARPTLPVVYEDSQRRERSRNKS